MRSHESRSAPPRADGAHWLRRWWLDLSLRAKGFIVVAVPLIALMGLISANLLLDTCAAAGVRDDKLQPHSGLL
jgi:hypothetical protein